MSFSDIIKKYGVNNLYEIIRRDENPVFIWGTGALARSVYQYCKAYGIHPAGCFVNIPEKGECRLQGLKRYTLEELLQAYNKFSVIIGHSDYAKGVEQLKNVPQVVTTYCLSSVCYGKGNRISEEFIEENDVLLSEIYNGLDDFSKNCLHSYFESRVNDDASCMFSYFKDNINYYSNDVLQLGNEEVLLDVGACVGASIWMFLDAVQSQYKGIVALEPEKSDFEVLHNEIEKRNLKDVVLKNVCAYHKNGYVKFAGDSEQGVIDEMAQNYSMCEARTIDSLCDEIELASDISIIKINFAVSVPEILEGAKELIRRNKPKIIIRIGFDETVLAETYRAVKRLDDTYKPWFRYSIGIPQGLTVFFQ